MNAKYLAAFLVSAATSYAVFTGSDAEAATLHYFHGSECTANNLNSITYGASPMGNNGQMADTGSGAVSLYCSVEYGSDFVPNTTNGATVYGYAHTYSGCVVGDISIYACRTYHGGSGGTCGSEQTGGCNTNFGNAVDTSKWNNSGDFYYVYVQLSAPVSSSVDVLYGFSVTT
jgi:hypothetical protein